MACGVICSLLPSLKKSGKGNEGKFFFCFCVVPSGAYRILQRRDQVLKISCNHLLTPDLQLKPMSTSETSWCWTAQDYAEGEARIEQFAVKFKVRTVPLFWGHLGTVRSDSNLQMAVGFPCPVSSQLKTHSC